MLTVAVPMVMEVLMVWKFPTIGSEPETLALPFTVSDFKANFGCSPEPGEAAILPASITDLVWPDWMVKSSVKLAVCAEDKDFAVLLIVALVARSIISTEAKVASSAMPV